MKCILLATLSILAFPINVSAQAGCGAYFEEINPATMRPIYRIELPCGSYSPGQFTPKRTVFTHFSNTDDQKIEFSSSKPAIKRADVNQIKQIDKTIAETTNRTMTVAGAQRVLDTALIAGAIGECDRARKLMTNVQASLNTPRETKKKRHSLFDDEKSTLTIWGMDIRNRLILMEDQLKLIGCGS